MPFVKPGQKVCPLCSIPALKKTDPGHKTCGDCGASFPIGPPKPKPTKKGK